MPCGRSSSRPPRVRGHPAHRQAGPPGGAVHQPRERDLHDKPVPRLGGLAILAAVVVAGAALPAGRPGDARDPRRRGGHRADRRGRRHPPGGLPPFVKLAGQFGAAAIPVWCEVRVENVTLPFIEPFQLGDSGLHADARRDRGCDERRELHRRRRRLAAGVCTIAAATFAVIALSLDRDDAACSRRSPPGAAWASSGTTSTPRRSSWATPARTCSACCSPASRSRGC